MFVVTLVRGKSSFGLSQFQFLGFLGLIVCVLTPCRASAQHVKPPAIVAYLLAQPVGEDLPRFHQPVLAELPEPTIEGSLRLTSIERWESFQAEFGIRESRETPVRYAMANAMYHLNSVIFALSSFAQDVGGAMNWRHGDAGWQETDAFGESRHVSRPKTLLGHFNEMHFKVDAEVVNEKPYVGCRLMIPFGS